MTRCATFSNVQMVDGSRRKILKKSTFYDRLLCTVILLPPPSVEVMSSLVFVDLLVSLFVNSVTQILIDGFSHMCYICLSKS